MLWEYGAGTYEVIFAQNDQKVEIGLIYTVSIDGQ